MSDQVQISVEENIGLVHLCIKRFCGKGVDYDDLFQIGCVGLVKATKNFDSQRGLKFSTYAVPVILGEIKGFFRADGIIKVSRSIKDLSRKVQKETEKYNLEHKSSPTISHLSKVLGESEEKISEAINSSNIALSLTCPEEDGCLQADIREESAEEFLTDKLSLFQTLDSLDEFDKKLISLRYFKDKTQKETAKELGCSQVQVSRREKKVLIYMRSKLG